MSKFKLSGSIKGAQKVLKKLEKLSVSTEKGQVKAVQEATLLLHNNAVRSLQTKSVGHAEIRYSPKRNVIVSKPGEAPNTDTGRAVQSIKFEFDNKGMVGRVGTNLKYLAQLEFGTRHIAPRPWLSLAMASIQKQVGEIFRRNIKESIKDALK